MPHLDAIQHAFGKHDVTDVQAHVGGAASGASEAMGAEAYAMGAHVAFRSSPDLYLAAHEAAHVVQQRKGVTLPGGRGQAGDAYERHADTVADAVVRGESADALLDQTQSSASAVPTAQDDSATAQPESVRRSASEPSAPEPAAGSDTATAPADPATDQPEPAAPSVAKDTADEESAAITELAADARTRDRRQRMEHVLAADAAAMIQTSHVEREPVAPALELPPPRPLPELAPPSWEDSAEAMAREPSWQEKLEAARSELQDTLARAEDQLGQAESGHERVQTQLEQVQQTRERMNALAEAPHPMARMQAQAWQQREPEISDQLEHQAEALGAAAIEMASTHDRIQTQLDQLPGPDELGTYIAENPEIERAFQERAAPRQEQEIADLRAQHAAQDAALREEARQVHQQTRAEQAARQQEMQQQTEAEIVAVKDAHRARGEQAMDAHEAEMAALEQQTTTRVDDCNQSAETEAATTIADGQSEAAAVEQAGEQQAAAIIAAAQERAAAIRAQASAAAPSVQMKQAVQFRVDDGQMESSGAGLGVENGDDADTVLQQAFTTADELSAAIREQVACILAASGEDAADTIRAAQQQIDAWLSDTANQQLLSGAGMETFIFNDLTDAQNQQIVVILDANQMAVDNFANYQIDINPDINQQNPYLNDPLRHTTESISNYNANINQFSYDLTYDYNFNADGTQMGLVFDFQSTADGQTQPRVISSTVLPYDQIISMTSRDALASSDREVSSNVLLHNELGMGRPFTDHNWLFSAAGIDFTTQRRTEDAGSVGDFANCNTANAGSAGNSYSYCTAFGSYDFNGYVAGREGFVSLDSQRASYGYADAVLEHSVARYGIVDQLVSNNLIQDPTLSRHDDELYDVQWGGELESDGTSRGATTYGTFSLIEATTGLATTGQPVTPQAGVIYDVTPSGDLVVISADGTNGTRGTAGRVVTREGSIDGQGHVIFAGPYPGEGTTSRPSRMIPFVPNAHNDATTINNLANGSQGHLTGE